MGNDTSMFKAAMAIESFRVVPAGKKFKLVGQPGDVLLRTVTRDRYRFLAVHSAPVNSATMDARRHLTFHARRDLCKPEKSYHEGHHDKVLKIVEVAE
mgnify:CR=1 FL=1